LWRAEESQVAMLMEGASIKLSNVGVSNRSPDFGGGGIGGDFHSSSGFSMKLSLSAMKQTRIEPLPHLQIACSACHSASLSSSSSAFSSSLSSFSSLSTMHYPHCLQSLLARRPTPLSMLSSLPSSAEFDTVVVLVHISAPKQISLPQRKRAHSQQQQYQNKPIVVDEGQDQHADAVNFSSSSSSVLPDTFEATMYSLYCVTADSESSEVLKIEVLFELNLCILLNITNYIHIFSRIIELGFCMKCFDFIFR
jgi:hypothetical protein